MVFDQTVTRRTFMKPEEINDRFINRFVEKLKNMPCIPAEV